MTYPYVFPSSTVTFTGPAVKFLTGPVEVSSPFSAAPNGAASGPSSLAPYVPDLNPKPLASDPLPTSTIPPSVSCTGPGCYPISTSSAATTNLFGLNAYDNRQVNPFTVEPPDQGLCAGGGYVMESLNQGEVQVYSESTLAPVSGAVSLDTLMGLTSLGWSSGGDVMCQYDAANGGHWFVTQFVSSTSEASGGPFAGCFAGVYDTCYEGIAVSATSNPMGAYNVYFLNADTVNNDLGSNSKPDCIMHVGCFKGVLLNDYAKTALTRDAFLLFYDEFSLASGRLNGAQQFAFSKAALEQGVPAASVNVAYENMGTAPNLTSIPTNGAYQPVALPGHDWYQVIPAQTTDPSQYDNANGGTGFMIASLDFFGAGDNRTAAFDWTGLLALNSPHCSSCASIKFGGALLSGTVTYQDEGAACPVTDYASNTFCGLAPQKAGPIPLGDNCQALGLNGTDSQTSCPEAGIMTNGDGATNAFYSQGTIWTAVSTIVNQTFASGPAELHVGATYWGVSALDSSSSVTFSLASQGYISASHEDIEFPAMAASGGTVLASFTLSGDGGPTGADSGGFYPSAAYLVVSGPGSDQTIHIAALGHSPQDGFTEYQYNTGTLSVFFRPRWGDYGQALFDPTVGRFFFSSEYIQSPNCSDSAYLADHTCGGTRVTYANWGSSISSLSP